MKKLPYANCFAAATARLHKATLVTSNKDFQNMESEIRIEWI